MKINGNPDGGGGGAAVWGGITGNINSQTDLNQKFVKKTGLKTVNEQSLVGSGDIEVGTLNPEDLKTINSTSLVGEGDIVTGTLNPGDLKTINSQSIVGTGDIEVGGLTPEQEAAIEPLEEPSEGILYTKINGAYSVTEKQMSAPNISDSYNFLEVIGGDVYYTYQDSLWKYDSDLQDFVQVGGYFGMELKPIWKDNSGRIYSGYDYQLDIENVSYTYIQQTTGYDLRYAWSDYNRTNIFIGDKGIYDLNYSQPWGSQATKSYKFDEETQTFHTGQAVAGVIKAANKLQPWFKYKGHYLFSNSSSIFEITEGDDEVLTTSNVEGTYFTPITLSSGRGINDFNYFVKGGILYYLDADDQGNDNTVLYVYNESTESWDDHELDAKLELGRYFVSGDFLISPDLDHTKMYMVYLGSTTSVDTSWKNVASIAVDLTSDQTISGNKSFTGDLIANSLNVTQDVYTNTVTTQYVTTSHINGRQDGIYIMVNDLNKFTVNDKIISTLDNCFYNTEEVSPGSQFSNSQTYIGSSYDIDENAKMWYVTPSNRVIYVNDNKNTAYEYDDVNDEFTQISMNNKIVSNHRVVLNQGTELWVAKNGGVYRWNDTTSDFDYIIGTPDGGDFIWQGDDTTLRYKSADVLVYDSGTGTYSWDNATHIAPYDELYSFKINGDIFLFSNYDNYLYSWDETTGNAGPLSQFMEHPQDDFIAQVGDYLYYYAYGSVRRVNPYSGLEFDVQTNIPVSRYWQAQNYPPILNYKGKYYTTLCNNNNEFFTYTYEYSYWTPKPDTSTDGTYTLKASVVNGQVTYEWVLDQI